MWRHVGGQIEFGRIFYPHLIKCAEKARLIQALQFVLQYFTQYRFNKTYASFIKPFVQRLLRYAYCVTR
jgi:hypothetical protein